METNELLISSLKLEADYEVSEIKINDNTKEIYVFIKSKTSEFSCPDCSEICTVHDRILKKWRHVDFVDYKVFIEYKTPRIKCKEHGVRLKEVSWAKPRHAFTLTMEEFIFELSQKIPLVHVGKIIGEHDTRIKRVVSNVEKEHKNDQNK